MPGFCSIFGHLEHYLNPRVDTPPPIIRPPTETLAGMLCRGAQPMPSCWRRPPLWTAVSRHLKPPHRRDVCGSFLYRLQQALPEVQQRFEPSSPSRPEYDRSRCRWGKGPSAGERQRLLRHGGQPVSGSGPAGVCIRPKGACHDDRHG